MAGVASKRIMLMFLDRIISATAYPVGLIIGEYSSSVCRLGLLAVSSPTDADHLNGFRSSRANYENYVHVKGKSKVFPYSLPSVGPGADPGVQAVSPQVT